MQSSHIFFGNFRKYQFFRRESTFRGAKRVKNLFLGYPGAEGVQPPKNGDIRPKNYSQPMYSATFFRQLSKKRKAKYHILPKMMQLINNQIIKNAKPKSQPSTLLVTRWRQKQTCTNRVYSMLTQAAAVYLQGLIVEISNWVFGAYDDSFKKVVDWVNLYIGTFFILINFSDQSEGRRRSSL